MMTLKALVRATKQSDFIISPRLHMWLMANPQPYYSAPVADFVRKQISTPPRIRSGSFSASAAGQCHRRQVLQYLGVPTGGIGNGSGLQAIFDDGKWRHLRWQANLLEIGLLDRAEVPLDWPRMRSKGSMDGQGYVDTSHPNKAWHGLEYGFELKGVNPFAYGNYVKQGGKPEHKRQVHRYFLSSGLDLFIIIYEDKGTQAWHEWVIRPDDQLLQEQEEEIEQLNEYVDHKELPQIQEPCMVKKGDYKNCPYGRNSGMCFKVQNWDNTQELVADYDGD